MNIPVLQGLVQSRGPFVESLEAAAFDGQRLELLPPRLNQIEPQAYFGMN